MKFNIKHNPFVKNIIEKAERQIDLLNFPSKKQDRWRFNHFNDFKNITFSPSIITKVEQKDIQNHGIINSNKIVLINGKFCKQLSEKSEEGIFISDLSDALSQFSEKVESQLAKIASYDNNYFTAVNTSNIIDGLYINISKNFYSKKTIHVLNISTGIQNNFISYPRILIDAEKNSNVDIIEQYISLEDYISSTNTVTEIRLHENSQINYLRLQSENSSTYHISHVASNQKQNSKLYINNITYGGYKTINDTVNNLEESGAEVLLNGIFITKDSQFVDNHTKIIHSASSTISNENFKGILSDSSNGIFDGKIVVNEGSQKIVSSQSNKNLLLSKLAKIQSNPQLQIYADDVKCSHGSTTGELDEDALFYLQTRGFSKENSEKILIEGFANDIINNIKFDEIRNHINKKISKLNNAIH